MIFKPGLYIVSTPIGNLDDITLRAIETLKNSTIILCENTRNSQKLLAKHNIKSKLEIYNDYSNEITRENICAYIDEGHIISLISDAGTPLISDPGYKLLRELKDKNYHIEAIPGVSSPIVALTLSTFPTDRFLFAGFLPKSQEKKKKFFEEFLNIKATLIFFETANRLNQSLEIASQIFGSREICVARELTKLYQEIKVGDVEEIREFYIKHPPKGEVILLISPQRKEEDVVALTLNLEQLLKSYFIQGLSAKNATEMAYNDFKSHYSKKEIYYMANKLKKSN